MLYTLCGSLIPTWAVLSQVAHRRFLLPGSYFFFSIFLAWLHQTNSDKFNQCEVSLEPIRAVLSSRSPVTFLNTFLSEFVFLILSLAQRRSGERRLSTH